MSFNSNCLIQSCVRVYILYIYVLMKSVVYTNTNTHTFTRLVRDSYGLINCMEVRLHVVRVNISVTRGEECKGG